MTGTAAGTVGPFFDFSDVDTSDVDTSGFGFSGLVHCRIRLRMLHFNREKPGFR